MGRKAIEEKDKKVQMWVYVTKSDLELLGGKTGIDKMFYTALRRAKNKKLKDAEKEKSKKGDKVSPSGDQKKDIPPTQK